MTPTIKLYPEIIFLAKKRKLHLGGFRVWFISKDFDRGNGNIPVKAFLKHLKSIGINNKTYNRWLNQAEELGLVVRNGSIYKLASWEYGAEKAGANQLSQPVLVPLANFVSAGWLAWAWAGYLIHFGGKPITRGTLEKLTGVPERTQLEYEKKSGVISTANYANLCDPTKDPHRAIYLHDLPGHYNKNGLINRRLGNTYHTSGISLGNKGRTKQVNAALRNSEGSSQKPGFTLYCITNEQLKRKLRASRKNTDARNRPEYVFKHVVDLPKGSVWDGILL